MGKRRRAHKKRFMRWSEMPPQNRQLVEVPGWHSKIYALVDPYDDTVRYIGKTTTELFVRLALHRSKRLHSLRNWFATLSDAPLIRLISYATEANVDGMEMEWIAFTRVNYRLLNVDPGGEFRRDGKPCPEMIRLAKVYRRAARIGKITVGPPPGKPKRPKGPPGIPNPKNAKRNAERSERKRLHTLSDRCAEISARQMARAHAATADKTTTYH